MKEYTVHIGVRLTTNVRIIADSEDEALEKAEALWNGECGITYDDMEFAEDDFSVINETEKEEDE